MCEVFPRAVNIVLVCNRHTKQKKKMSRNHTDYMARNAWTRNLTLPVTTSVYYDSLKYYKLYLADYLSTFTTAYLCPPRNIKNNRL